ncbi:MAG: tol-pal system protein YbgF [Gammaproteobacteria bacterium TMED78]|nr:MAG: tol-pal system protein YbgF [Gammaproteobacteria bacterium TMED78]
MKSSINFILIDMIRKIFFYLILFIGGCTTLPQAEDPVFVRLTEMETRIQRIERVVNNESLVEIVSQLDLIQRELQELRGEVEVISYEFSNNIDRQRDIYIDLDNRLTILEGGSVNLITNLPPVAVDDSFSNDFVTGDDRDNYNEAFELLRQSQWLSAAEAFQTFLTIFPTSDLADNAQFWLAETFYVQGSFQDAIPMFQSVVNEYESSDKLADALLKIGFCFDEIGQPDNSFLYLNRVIEEFPDSTLSRLASERISLLAE